MSELPRLGLVLRIILGMILRIVLSKMLVCNWTKMWHTVARQFVGGASTIVQSTCRMSSGGLFIRTNMTGG